MVKQKARKPIQFPCLMLKPYISLARREGLEPPTYWFVASHSIRLSYRRTFYGKVRFIRLPKYNNTSIIKKQAFLKIFFRDLRRFFQKTGHSRTTGAAVTGSERITSFCVFWILFSLQQQHFLRRLPPVRFQKQPERPRAPRPQRSVPSFSYG